MTWVRKTLLYTLLLFACSVAAGFVLGIVTRIVGVAHTWGEFDTGAMVRVIAAFGVALWVFTLLAKKHPGEYWSTGAGVVLLTSVLSNASAYSLAQPAERENYNWIALVVWALFFNAVALVIPWLVLRFRASSSNSSLERTRER